MTTVADARDIMRSLRATTGGLLLCGLSWAVAAPASELAGWDDPFSPLYLTAIAVTTVASAIVVTVPSGGPGLRGPQLVIGWAAFGLLASGCLFVAMHEGAGPAIPAVVAGLALWGGIALYLIRVGVLLGSRFLQRGGRLWLHSPWIAGLLISALIILMQAFSLLGPIAVVVGLLLISALFAFPPFLVVTLVVGFCLSFREQPVPLATPIRATSGTEGDSG